MTRTIMSLFAVVYIIIALLVHITAADKETVEASISFWSLFIMANVWLAGSYLTK